MVVVVGAKFKENGKIYYFDPNGLTLEKDMDVLVETIKGDTYASVVEANKEIPEDQIATPLKKVIRIATEADRQRQQENEQRAQKAFDICLQKIEEHQLDMKLVNVEYTFDNKKIIFYFTADQRIDFRELVKSLAAIFNMRIEMRQIGLGNKANFFTQNQPIQIEKDQEWWEKYLDQRGFYR